MVPLSMEQHAPSPLAEEDRERKYLRQEKVILEEIIAVLTHELFVELIQIDEQREYLIDVMQSERTRVFDLRESEVVALADSPLREDESDEERLKEIYKIEGLGERKPPISSKQRPANLIHISPATSENSLLDAAGITHYAQLLINYLIGKCVIIQTKSTCPRLGSGSTRTRDLSHWST